MVGPFGPLGSNFGVSQARLKTGPFCIPTNFV